MAESLSKKEIKQVKEKPEHYFITVKVSSCDFDKPVQLIDEGKLRDFFGK